MNLEKAFEEAERLGKLRTTNQDKAFKDFCDKKRQNEIQKERNQPQVKQN